MEGREETPKTGGRTRLLAVTGFIALGLLLSAWGPAHAEDRSTAGIFRVEPRNRGIAVTAPYSGDANGNSSLHIAWGVQGSDWGDAATVELPHAPSPYAHLISGLENHQGYQVRLTLADPEGLAGEESPQVFLEVVPRNPLVHSSLTTGSTKWPSGWGLPGGRYGRFTCLTCHTRNASNIMRIRSDLAVSDPESSDVLPIEADSGEVVLTSTVPGSADLGDDSRTPSSTSSHICEACHTRNKHHNYDTALNTSGRTDHYNRADCIGCHRHRRGFKASCDGCHTPEPSWPSHPVHLADGPLMEALECGACHPAAEHLNGLSEIRFDAEDARLAAGVYSDQGGDETSRYSEGSGYGDSPAYGSCDQLYCHSNGAPFDGPVVYRQPVWGGATRDCTSCHEGGSASTTLSGRHLRHAGGDTYAYDCVRCHAATVADADTVIDSALHLNGEKDVALAAGESYDSASRGCSSVYCHGNGGGTQRGCNSADCHGDGRTAPGPRPVAWSDSAGLPCYGCHPGRAGYDPRGAQMNSGGHFRLANDHWIRQYPCGYCHAATVDGSGQIADHKRHANGVRDVAFDPKWAIPGRPAPSYDSDTGVCLDLYCHSDGTTVNPEVRDFPWTLNQHADCDSCHGHRNEEECVGCHGEQVPAWAPEDQWKRAMPMYANTGPGTERANSHLRHLETNFSCENCHATTVVGACGDCHGGTVPSGTMTEVGHVDADWHVNKVKDVVFKDGGSYDPVTKRCSGTACHVGSDPVWGDSVQSEILCLSCHGTTGTDVDDFDAFNGTRGRVNMDQWFDSGHGREAESGPYPSGNPPADFPGNPCWYCHDNEVLHQDPGNPFRLKMHPQFSSRFEKECVYCHMERTDEECLGCHNDPESLSPQLAELTGPTHRIDHAPFAEGGTTCLTSGCHLPMDESQCRSCHADSGNPAPQLVPGEIFVGSPDPPYSVDHAGYATDTTSCLLSGCHTVDAHIHNTGAGTWDAPLKADVKNQYMMMGVCLQCHDDDDNGRCNSCHSGPQYVLGYDPGTGFKSGSSKAGSTHFGFKHFADYQQSGMWRGGKFCWDCHDPHGDANLYMIQDQVAVVTDGTFGVPQQRATVSFTKTQTGLDYARNNAPYDGICNVCHQEQKQHYRYDYGDGHQSGRVCTSCHNHGFADGHASGQGCDSCHQNKPISTHTAFSQPRDCTKCHQGAILKRMDIMRQFRGRSHHVQGVEVTNRHCYACHWEATPEGLINLDYHEGYNYRTHEGTSNAKSDLVIWGPGLRPERYELGGSAQTFRAENIGTPDERAEVAKVTEHCLGCHSDQNKDTDTFGDCKTPRRYAWDRSSIAARYLQDGTANWGKYPGVAGAARKIQTKSYSAHGNAVANQGGWSTATGEDGSLPNTRAGSQNVQCFDCHSSHGSFTEGVTSSYVTFDGSRNGGNLKETQAGKGGYGATYRAQAKTDGVNPMAAGAAQCFDCHETRRADRGTPETSDDRPWGFESTYGASQPIMGYRDSSRFGETLRGAQSRFAFKASRTVMGGHLQASAPLSQPAERKIEGLCTPCHDPHGVSPSLGADRAYALPLLKGTWLTSPYKEDYPQVTSNYNSSRFIYLDDNTFGGGGISEDEGRFAGLCLRCHPKASLTDGTDKNTPFKSVDRIHETVKGWGNNARHKFSCSKCHSPHVSGLPRLMRSNCLDYNHRGRVVAGGQPYRGDWGGYPVLEQSDPQRGCHGGTGLSSEAWPENQKWNTVTPW